MAVRAAADAMADVLGSAQVDYRLAVARTFAREEDDQRRGRLEGDGFTRELSKFQEDIIVGARGGWEPGLQTGLLAYDRLLPKTGPGQEDPQRLREDAATIVIHMSDERDQTVECAACGGCEEKEGVQEFCAEAPGQSVVDRFVGDYTSRAITSFALVGDLPNGCQQTSTRDDFEPGQGYVEVANATGGQFGSLCGDMRANLEEVARVATGVASVYELSQIPASATLRVAVGPPGQGSVIPRSRDNGFDYDAVQNKIIFYGTARPKKNEEVVVGYRRWDWANNPQSPADPCDDCAMHTSCDPGLDIVECEPVCGETVCQPGLACLLDTAECGDPTTLPPVGDDCGGCDPGLVCDLAMDACVPPCEETGCGPRQVCSSSTHLCQVPNF